MNKKAVVNEIGGGLYFLFLRLDIILLIYKCHIHE